MNNKIADFIDSILLFLALSSLSVIVMGYFTNKINIILPVSFIIGLGLTGLINKLKQSRRLPKGRKKELDKTLDQFIFRTHNYNYEYIKKALETKYTVIDKHEYLLVNKTAVFVCITAEKFSFASLCNCYGNALNNVKSAIILTGSQVDNETLKLCASLPNIDMEIFCFDKVYALLKWLNYLPKEDIILKKNKNSIKTIAKNTLSRTKAKHYLFAAIILLFSSMFMPYSIYYLIISVTLIVLSLLCQLDILKLIQNSGKQKKTSK